MSKYPLGGGAATTRWQLQGSSKRGAAETYLIGQQTNSKARSARMSRPLAARCEPGRQFARILLLAEANIKLNRSCTHCLNSHVAYASTGTKHCHMK
eukprot:994207-Pleurochrysis_carterae.AAC.1